MEDKVELVETNNLTRKQNIILYFFIYAFLGWILETAFCILTTGVFTKRGFLYGPICPIYGFGAILLIESLKNIKANTVGKFFVGMIAFTIFEYVVSVVLESLFGLRWWDYTGQPFNFQGRVSLSFSIVWGILGVIFVEKIHPFITKAIEKKIVLISNKKKIIILYSFVFITIIDFICSVVKYVNI